MRTWRIFSERPQDCVGVFLACAPLYIVAGQALTLLAAPHEVRKPPEFGPIAALFGVLMCALFQAWVSVGLVIILRDIVRGREFDFGNVFGGARFVVRAVLAGSLFAMAIAFPLLVAFLAEAIINEVVRSVSDFGPIVPLVRLIAGFLVALVGLLAALVPGLRLSQFLFLIIDRDAGVFDSLRLSFLITRGHAWRIFQLALLALALNSVGLLLFSIGVIFTAPFTALLFVVAYQMLITEPVAGVVSKGKPPVEAELELL